MIKKFLLLTLFLLFGAGMQRATANDKDTVWYRILPSSFDVSSIKFSPDDQKIFAFSNSANAVRIINVADGKTDTVLSGYKDGVFTADGRYMISYGGKNLYKVDLQDFSRTTPFDTAIENIQSVSISDNGLIACILYKDLVAHRYQFHVWDYNTGKIVFTKEYKPFTDDHKTGRGINDIQLSKNGSYLFVSVAEGYTIANKYFDLGDFSIVYDMNTKDSVRRIDNGVRIYPSNTGKYVTFIPYKEDEEFFIYNTEIDSIIFTKHGENNWISNISYTSDDKYFSVSYRGTDVGRIEIWDLFKKEYIKNYRTIPAGYSFFGVDISHNNDYIFGSSGSHCFLYYLNIINEIPNNIIEATITYPNPVNNIFNLEFNLTIPNLTNIDLIDLTGNTVQNIENTFLTEGNHQYSVNIADLPAGAYILRINSGNFSYTNQIIKQ
jgi:hypothetical protein